MTSKLLFQSSHLDEGEQGVALRHQTEEKSSLKRVYYSPITQVVLLGFICFSCPGLFNALSSLGGGGQVSTKVASNSLTALYSTFAVCSFFAGSFINVMGIKRSLFLGSLGYSLYVASFLTYNIRGDQVSPFVITSGALLGVSASLLWTSQSTLMLSLPSESEKGKFISTFWVIFNAGDVIGSAILLGETASSDDGARKASVSTAGYSVFLGLTAVGTLLAFVLVSPRKITRSDGTRVVTPIHPSWRREIIGLFRCLQNDPFLFLTFPFFAVSNIFYVYHFNGLNAGLFSLRSRALNSLLYWLAQIIAAPVLGAFLDSPRFSRRTRALSGWVMVLVLVQIVWGCSYLVQKTFTRDSSMTLDFGGSTSRSYYAGVSILYVFCGFTDSAWQILAFYLIGSLSNNPRKLAYISGFYKAFQSALNAVFWHLDADRIPYMKLLIVTWSCLSAALLVVLPMFLWRVRNYTTTNVKIVETEAELETEYATIDDSHSIRSTAEDNDVNKVYRKRSRVDRLPTLEEDAENQGLGLVKSSSHDLYPTTNQRAEKGDEQIRDHLMMKNLTSEKSTELSKNEEKQPSW